MLGAPQDAGSWQMKVERLEFRAPKHVSRHPGGDKPASWEGDTPKLNVCQKD